MNKIIAQLFESLLTLIHIVFILFLLSLDNGDNPKVLNFIPDFLLRGSRTDLIIALAIAYTLFMGLFCTFISINTYLREIKEILDKKN